MPMQEPYKGSMEPLNLNFVKKEDVVDVNSVVEELNNKYPFAKLSSAVVEYKGNGVYSVSGEEMNFEGLENHVKNYHLVYGPKDADERINKPVEKNVLTQEEISYLADKYKVPESLVKISPDGFLLIDGLSPENFEKLEEGNDNSYMYKPKA